ELPVGFIIKVPTGFLLRDGAPQPCAEGVPQLVRRAPLVGSLVGIDPEVVEIHRNVAAERARAAYPPQPPFIIGIIVKKAKVTEIRTNGETIDMPRSNFAHDLESIEALPDVWSLSNAHEAARTIVQLLPSRSERNPVPFSTGTNVQECSFKIES